MEIQDPNIQDVEIGHVQAPARPGTPFSDASSDCFAEEDETAEPRKRRGQSEVFDAAEDAPLLPGGSSNSPYKSFDPPDVVLAADSLTPSSDSSSPELL